VLKKAGIVVATAAAGLLAVSPLAFAGDKDDHEGRDHDGKQINKIDDSNRAEGRELVFIADNNVAISNCYPSISDDDKFALLNDLTGALSLLGPARNDVTRVNYCDNDASVDDSVEQENEHEND
jgi:hypothetical protein